MKCAAGFACHARSVRVAMALVLVLGCGGGSSPVDGTEDKPIARLDLPRLDESARVTVLANARPAALVWVSASGAVTVGKAGPTWNGDIAPPRPPGPEVEVSAGSAAVLRAVLEAVVLGGNTAQVDEARGQLGVLDVVERQREIRRRMMAAQNRRDDSFPAEGRLPGADAVPLAKLDRVAPLIVATPSAPASQIARVLTATGGALAVDHFGKLAVLDLAFTSERDPGLPGDLPWLEVWVDAAGLHLTTQPNDEDVVVPFAGALIDRAAFITAYRKLDRTTSPVDVVVRDDTTAQTLVEVLAALAASDIRTVAIAAGPAQMTERARQISAARLGLLSNTPSARMGQPNVQGDLDKPTIRFTVFQHLTEIRACYEAKLASDPLLAGTVQTQFFIAPTGKVASASASGVHAEVADCIAKIIRGIEFPKPDGGGGVQVNYPFTFRPATP